MSNDTISVVCPKCNALYFLLPNKKHRCECGEMLSTFPAGKVIKAELKQQITRIKQNGVGHG